MASSYEHLNNLRAMVSELHIRTNKPYERFVGLNQMFEQISKALWYQSERGGLLNEDGYIVWNYRARTKQTVNLRVLTLLTGRYVPDRPFKVKDVGIGSHTGMVDIVIPNGYYLAERSQHQGIKVEPESGIQYTVVLPKNWHER